MITDRCAIWKLGIMLLLAGASLSTCAAKSVTVEQVEQVLAAAHQASDARLARRLSDLQVTERVSALRLARWTTSLPEGKARLALIALADRSAFLDLPTAEIPDLATPDLATQNQILALAGDYVRKAAPQLPNFLATRETTRFETTPAEATRYASFGPGMGPAGGPGGGETTSKEPTNSAFEPLHKVSRSSTMVFFRDGHEQIDTGTGRKRDKVSDHEFRTVGEFGPILTTILVDMAKGKWTWSHWEQGKEGQEAVFAYAVPQKASHYMVRSGDEAQKNDQPSAYQGEIAINPRTARSCV